jgi:hypothetical protein
MVGRNHGQTGKTTFGGLRLKDHRQALAPTELQPIEIGKLLRVR